MPRYAFRVYWSDADQAYVGICLEFESLSWLGPTGRMYEALTGIRELVAVVTDMTANGEPLPAPLS